MDYVFLGTGAAEAIPCYYCRCSYCNYARQHGGKDVRSRSSFRIDGRYQIDFSPDIFHQTSSLGLDTFELEHLFITHTHEDHFDLAEIIVKECAVEENNKPLRIYLSASGTVWAKKMMHAYAGQFSLSDQKRLQERYQFVPLEYFQVYEADGLKFRTVKGNHSGFGDGEYAINYLFELPNGKNLLYAVDTGWYSDETWDYLKGIGKTLDVLIMECTFGGREDRGFYVGGHLDVINFLMMLEKMSTLGVIGPETAIYATHINHKHHLMHEHMQQTFDQSDYKVTVAYDGLCINEVVQK